MLCSYTADALAAASQALVADAIGRQRSDDVVDVSRTVFVYSSVLGVLLGALLYVGFASHFLFDLFTNDEGTQLALLGVSSLLVLSQPLNSLVFAADGVLQGASEFPYQAKTMAVSAFVGICGFLVLQYVDPKGGELIHVWGAIIVLQAMRGLTSALKICDSTGPIRLLSPSGKDA
jgi:Na+-driven multidrug efflux pump